MAEVAIRWTEPLPGSKYELGDIIQISEDGYDWGTAVDPRINPTSNFRLILIPGVPAADLLQFVESVMSGEDVITKRKWKLDDIKLTNPIRNQINNNGFVSITQTQWNAFITDKGA